jgi:uncharacterized protein (TIGR01777 family)
MTNRNSRRIVLTGATGLIGTRVVKALSERGDHVVALVRDTERARRSAPGAAEYLKWSDSATEGEWVSRLDGADAVVNLAGSPISVRWTERTKQEAHNSRVRATRHLVEAIARVPGKPSVLVNASAVGYYGASPTGVVTESSPSGSDFLARLCAEWESEARKVEADGVRVVLVRTGIALDPRGGALAKLLTPFKLFVGGPLGSGKQPFPWIHIDDEVGILLWALDTPSVEGPINATAPKVVTNKEFSSILGEVLHRPSVLPVPEFALRILFGEAVVILTEGQHAIPERTRQLGYRFRHDDPREALLDLLRRK